MELTLKSQRVPVLCGQSLYSYLDAVHRIPKLSREEEVTLFEQYKDGDNVSAARALVLAHLRYVVYIAKQYSGYGLPLEDLIQQVRLSAVYRALQRPPVAHMKALNALSSLPDHEILIRILRYVLNKFSAKSHHFVALGRRV